MANPLDPVSLNEMGTFAPRSSGVPGMATLLRRSRKRPKAGVSTLQVQPEGAGPCLDCQTPSQEPPDYVWPTVGAPRVPWEQVRAMPEGAELIEGGRVWARLPGGQPVKIFDGWERGGPLRYGLDAADDGLEEEEEDLLPVQLSVNFPNYYAAENEGEVRFGTADIITADLRKRRVKLVRHPGQAQLFMDNLLDGLGRGEPIPVYLVHDDEALESLIRESRVMENLLDLLARLYANDMKVMLTLLTFGGGGAPYVDEFDSTRDSPALLWSPDHQGQTLVDPWFPAEDPKPFNRATADTDPTPAGWDLSTFDPDNPYKRLLYRRVCAVVARILEEKASADGYGWIKDVIAGVEIGNELDVRHKLVTSTGQEINPEPWGVFYAECAVAIRQENDWLPIWLPGLTSYAMEGEPGDRLSSSWWGKVDWVRDLLSEIGVRLGQINSTLGLDLAMDHIVAGMDVHWYHTDDDTARRALLLPLELEELRTALVAALGAELGGRIELTVTECGINTMCGEDPWLVAWPWLDPSCDPAVVKPAAHRRPPFFVSSERWGEVHVTHLGYYPNILTWQAANLVIQVFCALAGGARTVGPHGHIELEPGEASHFAGWA